MNYFPLEIQDKKMNHAELENHVVEMNYINIETQNN